MQLNHGKNIRLFKNSVLEKLTYVHPITPALIWLPVSSYFFYIGIAQKNISAQHSIGLALFGLFFWSFAEYVLHRFVFHFHPAENSPIQKRIMFLIHGIHHEDPNDQRRLLMPPSAAAIIAVVLYGIFIVVLGKTYVNPFFSGFLIGYLIYDYIHFATHFVRFNHSVFLKLKQNHMRHHFVAEDKLFGVSSTFWDHVFGTRTNNRSEANNNIDLNIRLHS